VSDALAFFLSSEAVGLRCSKSGADLHAHKKNSLESLPSYLAVQLKRFDLALDAHTQVRKLCKLVSYPHVLVVDSAHLSSVRSAPSVRQRTYHLVSVVSHLGADASSGHYTCDVLSRSSSSSSSSPAAAAAEAEAEAAVASSSSCKSSSSRAHWLHFDDARVSPVGEQVVLSSCAYLLLYERRSALDLC
jgi:ubiquitin C-terminal hydrolase